MNTSSSSHAKTNLPTKQAPSGAKTWIPCPKKEKSKRSCSQEKARQGSAYSKDVIMLPFKNRLSADSDIKRVVTIGARTRTNIASVYIAPSKVDALRFACVVGKRVHKSAVVRHSIQRKIRAACKLLDINRVGLDVVIVATTPEIRFMGIQDIVLEISHAFREKNK